MANIGDKFIIEIGAELNAWASSKEEFAKDHDKKWYRIKGFNSLVFDDEGLKKLEPYKEEPKTKWKFHISEGFGECIECGFCGEHFGYGMSGYDFCPKCGKKNGRRWSYYEEDE